MEYGHCWPWAHRRRNGIDVSPGRLFTAGWPARRWHRIQGVTPRYSPASLGLLGIEGEAFAAVCVVVDKHDKIGAEATATMLADLGVDANTAQAILELMAVRGIERLGEVVSADNAGYTELRELLRLAEAAGMADRIQIDCSVVRGLSYYTGTVWECFDASGRSAPCRRRWWPLRCPARTPGR